jgi:hypothetical protein
MDKNVGRIVKELCAALKGKTDLEITEVSWEIQHRFCDIMKVDGTVEAAKRARRRVRASMARN